jgi:outer membrane scaffolding protein for murein synthesis (MipA/OmpV family)
LLLAVFTFWINFSLWASPSSELPLWELGVGMLNFRADHYRGSPQNKWYHLPFPAYTIRGKHIEGENGYIRGHIMKVSHDLVLDLSFNLGLGVNSEANDFRKGMEKLDPTFEVGPILRYYMWKSKDEAHFLNLEMPYRAVYATDLTYLDHVGYYSIPYLNLLSKGTRSTWGWGSEFSIGPQYGSSSWHNRFYAVNSSEVTSKRKYFHAVSGYSGTQFMAVFNRRYGDFLIIPFFRWDYLDGAVYKDSPLYKNGNYTFFGVGVVWYFAHSKERQSAPTMVK